MSNNPDMPSSSVNSIEKEPSNYWKSFIGALFAHGSNKVPFLLEKMIPSKLSCI